MSRVLNGVPTVAPEIRARVLKGLAETGYVPNAPARAIRTSRAGAIGIATTEIQNPFLPYLVDALTTAARNHDLTTIVWNDPDPAMPMAAAGAASGAVDGIVATATRSHVRGLLPLADKGFPVLLCNRAPDDVPIDVVTSGHVDSGAASAEYLARHGKRDVAAVFGPSDTFASPARERGFRAAAAEQGIRLRESRIPHGPTSYDSGFDAMTSLASDGLPEAVFCSSDIIALACLMLFAHWASLFPGTSGYVVWTDLGWRRGAVST